MPRFHIFCNILREDVIIAAIHIYTINIIAVQSSVSLALRINNE